MVTAGANQAFVNLVLTLCDESDSVVLFKPYYFNHMCVMMGQLRTLVLLTALQSAEA
jgi:aspartate/methionine/tyrosine aminotransferase